MAKIQVYNLHAKVYDRWYDDNRLTYESEIDALKSFVPKKGKGVDIGSGTGRFALPFHVDIGIEPSSAMRVIAQKRGVKTIDAVAEKLPFKDKTFDYALMVTVTCFLDDINKAFIEVHRILKPKGIFILAHIDKESFLGKIYRKNINNDPFLKDISLFRTLEILDLLKETGFHNFSTSQTLFEEYAGKDVRQPVKKGYGQGAYVVIKGEKK